MNLKKTGIVFSILLTSSIQFHLGAQSISDIKSDRQTYIWGEGMGETLKAADQAALVEIIGQISVQVESNFEMKTTENGKDFAQTVNDVIKTYTSATLKNTERIVLENEPEAKVFRYIRRSELTKIFESRKNKILDFAQSGESALKNLQVADALRYLYWSQTLLRSHPEANDIDMIDLSGKKVLLITWLPKQINDVFANISIKVFDVEDMGSYLNCLLDISYKDAPVRNMDFTYWGGQDWSNIVSAKDGTGVVELPKTQQGSDIRLKTEYVFEGESNIDLELRDVMQKVPQVPYKNSYLSFSSKPIPRVNTRAMASVASSTESLNSTASVMQENAAQVNAAQSAVMPTAASSTTLAPVAATNATSVNDVPTSLDATNATTTNAAPTITSLSIALSTNTTQAASTSPSAPLAETANLGTIQKVTDVADKEQIMKKIRAAIISKNYTAAEPLFTKEGYDIYKTLLQYGNAKIIQNNSLNYYQFGDFVICRSIPMSFSFKSNNRTFIEDIIFYFDKNNKICNLTFGLTSDAVGDIASNTTWSEANRMLIMSFLENYKTAYALKRWEYINSIFSDEALIITGFVTKLNSSPENRFMDNKIIRYNRQTKTEYMKKLRFTFDSNEFINIRFTNNTVRRSGKGNEIYGIQIKQDYYSANYGDMGYLFLLVDLSDTLKPVIHVRTWQPEKSADGSIYGLSDF